MTELQTQFSQKKIADRDILHFWPEFYCIPKGIKYKI